MDTKTFALHLKWMRSSSYYIHIQIQTRKLFIISQPSSLWSALYSKLGTPSSCLELNHKAYSSLTTCTWKQKRIPWGKSVRHPSSYSIKCACSGKSHMEGSINYLLATPLESHFICITSTARSLYPSENLTRLVPMSSFC